MSRQKQTAWGRVPSRSALSWASHWPAITFLIIPCTPQPLSQNPVDLAAEPDVLAAPRLQLKKEEVLFFSPPPFAELTAKFTAAETRSFGRVNTPVCRVSDDAAGSWCYRMRRVRGQTWSHWVRVQEERGRRWIQFRANGSVQLRAHLWGEWGPCVWRRKGPDLKSVLCVRWAECVTEGTIPECGDWGSLELAGLLWLLKTFTTMATGGSLCSWVKGQLEEFSLGSNRKAFVAPGTQDWLQLVPCEIACTAQDT